MRKTGAPADCLFPPDHRLSEQCCGHSPCTLEWYRPCDAIGGCWDRSTCNGCAEPREKSPHVSPDAEAMAAKFLDCEPAAARHLARLMTDYATAATMREREAIEQLIEEAIQSVTSPTATAARTMARTILSMVRARSIYPKGA